MKRRLNARIGYAKFLQDTVREMAKEVQNSRSGEVKQTAEDLDEFLSRVGPSNSSMICKPTSLPAKIEKKKMRLKF